jgi:hypothetical protein
MNSSAVRALSLEYKSLQEEPVEGFRVKLLSDENLFEWSVSGEEFPVNFLIHSLSFPPPSRWAFSGHQTPSIKAAILR